MNNKREYKYEVVLPVDTDNYQDQLKNIITSFDAIYCTHDKDVYVDDVIVNDELIHKAGDIKYKHTHFIIKFKTAKTISAVAKIIGCKETDIERIKNLNSALKYLIHYKDDNKYNYSINDVKYNSDILYKRFRELIFDDLDEEDKILPLIDYISSYKSALDLNTFVRFVILNRQWSVYRRNASTFIKLIEEHNYIYIKTGFVV